MVSVGPRDHLTGFSAPRAAAWASRNQYDFLLAKQALQTEGKPPQYTKLHIPDHHPGYDRYCIVDDDLLMTSTAPPLPDIPPEKIGLRPDAEQGQTQNPHVQWTGNTGFLVVGAGALDILVEAQRSERDPTVWGFSDQSVINSIAWKQGRVHCLDKRWNYAPVLEYFIQGKGWETWRTSRLYRASFYLKTVTRWPDPVIRGMGNCWGLHMIRTNLRVIFHCVLP